MSIQFQYYDTVAHGYTGILTLGSGVLITDGSGVPSFSVTLPAALTIPTATLTGITTLTGQLRSTYDGVGVIPASQATAGFSITSNYAGLGEVDHWSLVNSAAGEQGFNFYQKTAAGTAVLLSRIQGDASFFNQGFYLNNQATGFFYVDSSEISFGSSQGIAPFRIFTSGTPSFTAPNVQVCAPLQWASAVVPKTADFAPAGPATSFEYGLHYTTTGASGTVISTLPSDAGNGWQDTYTVDAAQILRLQCPASHTITIGAATSAAAGKAEASVAGASVTIQKIATNKFVATCATGSWTIT